MALALGRRRESVPQKAMERRAEAARPRCKAGRAAPKNIRPARVRAGEAVARPAAAPRKDPLAIAAGRQVYSIVGARSPHHPVEIFEPSSKREHGLPHARSKKRRGMLRLLRSLSMTAKGNGATRPPLQTPQGWGARKTESPTLTHRAWGTPKNQRRRGMLRSPRSLSMTAQIPPDARQEKLPRVKLRTGGRLAPIRFCRS